MKNREQKDREQGSGNRDQKTVNPKSLDENSQAAATAAATHAAIPGNGGPPQLDAAPLAYENSAFLNSADGRPIRIISEYLEPLARFRREQIQDTVVFFGSARFTGREEAGHALQLLENTGSVQPAPSEEQPAKAVEIATGNASDLQRKRASGSRYSEMMRMGRPSALLRNGEFS